MLKRILLAWLIANFVIAGVFALLTGGWYLRLAVLPSMAAELGLIMLPNLLIPFLLLRYTEKINHGGLKVALGWKRDGWRPILVGIAAFAIYLVLSTLMSNALGPGIAYHKPGQGGPITGVNGLILLPVYIGFVVFSVISEETMFRGLIQTQVTSRYGMWVGMALTMLLFGLRHLPADLFYAQLWHATPQMWIARQVDLYLGAGLLSLARYFGRSVYASATMHFSIFMLGIALGFLG